MFLLLDEKEKFKKYDFEQEWAEEKKESVYIPTEWPKPITRFRLIVEDHNLSIEEMYFGMLDHMRFHLNYSKIYKVVDLFSAAEQSSFFGAAHQRLAAQQDRVIQLLTTVGKMVKELFQLVRELRIIDERLHYYHDANNKNSASRRGAEITLKGIWIDMVEQGSKNPASVYGMARELQFLSLPDLFFKLHPEKPVDVDRVVEELEFNRKIKEVLKRKLRSFLEWKHYTFAELKVKRIFTLKYLRQHYEIIRMYINWVKPYLRNIKRLQLDQKWNKTVELVTAFEGSMVEIEILGVKKMPHAKDVFACLHCHWEHQSWGYTHNQPNTPQRPPIYIGKCVFTSRAYAWTQKDVDNYIKLREDEELELLGMIDGQIKAAIDALGEELKMYLKQAGDTQFESVQNLDKPVKPRDNPFEAWMKSIKDGLGIKEKKDAKGNKPKETAMDKQRKEYETNIAKGEAAQDAYHIYFYYKKYHEMITW